MNDPAAYAVGGSLYQKANRGGRRKKEMKKTRPVYGLTMILLENQKADGLHWQFFINSLNLTSSKRTTYGDFQENNVSSFR